MAGRSLTAVHVSRVARFNAAQRTRGSAHLVVDTIHLQLLLAASAAWVSRQQAEVITHLIEENRVLKEQPEARGQSSRITDEQRRRLVAKGKPGSNVLCRIGIEFPICLTPHSGDVTIRAWLRQHT